LFRLVGLHPVLDLDAYAAAGPACRGLDTLAARHLVQTNQRATATINTKDSRTSQSTTG
jgi:hypothetical protein